MNFKLLALIIGSSGLTGWLTWILTIKHKTRQISSTTARIEYDTAEEIATKYIAQMNKMMTQLDTLRSELMTVKEQLQKALDDINEKENIIKRLQKELEQIKIKPKNL